MMIIEKFKGIGSSSCFKRP